MDAEIRIVVADDHPIFRKGLVQVIEAERGLQVVAEAEDGNAALAYIQQLRPEIALLDIDMPGKNGFELVRAIVGTRIPTRVIFLTMHKDEDMLNEAMDLGVNGYLVKDSAVIEVVSSIRAVAAGRSYISPSISAYLIRRRGRARSLEGEKPGLEDLTKAERQILRLIADGKTSKEIAAEVYISYRTVENHRTNISAKLDLRGSHALVKFAIQHKSELS